jgi:predicted nuclease of restriction endonuclease-like (RecB) superfamily
MRRCELELCEHIVKVVEDARDKVSRSVNTAMVEAYWVVGGRIVEVEQKGRQRAGYGQELIQRLAPRLAERVGKGFSPRNLRRMRQFYLTYPQGSVLAGGTHGRGGQTPHVPSRAQKERGAPAKDTPPVGDWLRAIWPTPLAKSRTQGQGPFPPSLGWSHYLLLMGVPSLEARAFYEIEAVRESWSVRELERQIASLLFDRLTRNRDKDEVLALAKRGQLIASPRDVLKDPLVLEFLNLQEQTEWHERDLEQAIIHQLGTFLLELGKGFCFVARQKRITLDGDHFYIDLVLYNRLLRSFVLVDLKLGKLTHQDLGQTQMYVNYYDRFQRGDWESPTVGIVLCSEKNDAMVKITLPDENAQVHAQSYQLYLPTEDELRAKLVAAREELERGRG